MLRFEVEGLGFRALRTWGVRIGVFVFSVIQRVRAKPAFLGTHRWWSAGIWTRV